MGKKWKTASNGLKWRKSRRIEERKGREAITKSLEAKHALGKNRDKPKIAELVGEKC